MYLHQELEKYKLPALMRLADGTPVRDLETWELRRKEILSLFEQKMFGVPTGKPKVVNGVEIRKEPSVFGGKAEAYTILLHMDYWVDAIHYPIRITLPKLPDGKKPPVFFYLSFLPDGRDIAREEVIDNGYGIVNLYCQDVCPDEDDGFQNGLPTCDLMRNQFDSWGKISMWAWAVSRVMDYLMTRDDLIDTSRIALIGASRFGKTALWAGAQDHRFSLIAAMVSGKGGAELIRNEEGISKVLGGPAYWYCPNHEKLGKPGTPYEYPFDSHFLLALCAPMRLYVCNATEDRFANWRSEFLACTAAEEAYRLYGKSGLITPDRYPEVGELLHEGEIGYHCSKGDHFWGRQDLGKIMRYRDRYGC